jgi:hypothetical protein
MEFFARKFLMVKQTVTFCCKPGLNDIISLVVVCPLVIYLSRFFFLLLVLVCRMSELGLIATGQVQASRRCNPTQQIHGMTL